MPKESVAVIGSGISGLACAYWLGERYDVTVFERHGRLGGHVDTHHVTIDGTKQHVDTGFIVFNRRTYPLFCDLLQELGVESQATDMSFGVMDDVEGWEFCGRDGIRGILSQPRNLLRPRFLKLMREILRFGRVGRHALTHGKLSEEMSMAEYLELHSFSDQLANAYLIPFGASIWSADPQHFLDYPAASLLRFFSNHGILDFRERPTWETIVGGSRTYVERMQASGRFASRVNSPIDRVLRHDHGVSISSGSSSESFDHVVFAVPAPIALSLLGDASEIERSVLSCFTTIPNAVTLHTDTTLMPQSRKAWGAWNYHRQSGDSTQATLTYWMNLLQRLDAPSPALVTLNCDRDIAPQRVLKQRDYVHPVFNGDALRAQYRWRDINGTRRTWFAGAYWFNGFHEDGARSARRVADALGHD